MAKIELSPAQSRAVLKIRRSDRHAEHHKRIQGKRPAADVLLSAATEHFGKQAIGVILSGDIDTVSPASTTLRHLPPPQPRAGCADRDDQKHLQGC
ncbi:chemotaxis protein CheB [Pseudoroseomonas wenyumeiae]